MSQNRAVGRGAGAHVLEDFLHLNDVAFESGHFGNRGHLALAVGLALKLHNELNGVSDLAADRSHRHRKARHADHLLKA